MKKISPELFHLLLKISFSLFIFLIIFLIFQLIGSLNDIHSSTQSFENSIIKGCETTEKGVNEVLALHQEIANRTITDLTLVVNLTLGGVLNGLIAILNLFFEIAIMYVKFKTSTARCGVKAGLSIGSNVFFEYKDEVEFWANQQLAAPRDLINSQIDTIRSDLEIARESIQEFTNNYNSVVAQLAQANINLPPLAVNLPIIPNVSIPPLVFPNIPPIEEPNFDDLENQFFDLINPISLIRDELSKIKISEISSEKLFGELNFTERTNVQFCQRLDFQQFNEQVSGIENEIKILIAVITLLLIGYLLGSAAIIIKRFPHEEEWIIFKYQSTLREFFKKMNHKPSLQCLFVGILGVIILVGIQISIVKSKNSLQIALEQDFQEFSNSTLLSLNKQLGTLSSDFANALNKEILEASSQFFDALNKINGTTQQVTQIQQKIDDYLNAQLLDIPIAGEPLINLIHCMISILDFPLDSIFDFLPSPEDIPLVPQNVLNLNLTRIETYINKTIQLTDSPFNYYYMKVEEKKTFFYLMIAYGSPVILVGMGLTFWNLFQKSSLYKKCFRTET